MDLANLEHVLDIISVSFLIFLFWEDMKSRLVWWGHFLALFVIFSVRFGLYGGEFHFIYINFAFIALQVLAIGIYIFLKQGTIGSINKFLGIGDILFWIILAVAFSPFNFMAFYIVSIIFSAVVFYAFLKKSTRTIPLAGLQGLMLIFFTAYRYLIEDWNVYDDFMILNWF